MFISFLCRRLPGDRDPGLFPLLPHHNILNLTHQGVHIDEEQGGWEGKKEGGGGNPSYNYVFEQAEGASV